METTSENIKKEIKKIKPIDYIFLGIIIVTIFIITIIFFHSTSFILKNINKIFTPDNTTTSQTLEIKRYSQIEKKLNLLSGNKDNTNVEKIQPLNIPTDTTDNKKLLKINIINTSTKDGAAGALSKELERNGFSKSTTGSKTIVSSTIISIKESKKEYGDSLKKIVEKSYPKISTLVSPENGEYDVIIIIGK